jgi:hypothetical protein
MVLAITKAKDKKGYYIWACDLWSRKIVSGGETWEQTVREIERIRKEENESK